MLDAGSSERRRWISGYRRSWDRLVEVLLGVLVLRMDMEEVRGRLLDRAVGLGELGTFCTTAGVRSKN